MKNNTIIKIILIIFFTIFFGFLFWFFYNPNNTDLDVNNNETDFFEDLFPFSGGSDNIDDKKDDNTNQELNNNQIVREEIPRLRQISDIPTVSVYFETISKSEVFNINKDRKSFDKLDEYDLYSEIRYVSIKNSHVYQTFDFTKNKKKISNITIPKIIQANFFNKNNFIIRYKNEFDILKTYVVNLSDKIKEELESDLERKNSKVNYDLKIFKGIFFPDNIHSLFINKDENMVFYTTFINTYKEKDGKIHGIISTKTSKNKKEIFSSDLREWNFSFNNSDKIFASTKNSGKTNSLAFSLNTDNGFLNKISRAEKGLNGLPNKDFSKVLFSKKNVLNSYILVVEDQKNKQQQEFNISTFIDKCVWSKNNIDFYCAVPKNKIDSDNQPDNWYKGKKYFRDDILKINSETGMIEIIFNSIIEGKYFDIIDLKIDDREKYLYWKNKKTDFVWSYDMYY